MTEPTIGGIHHVTAIASDPQPNLGFYVRFLGLRLVKQTVNFDDPETYHFYYGDRTGQPGTILTFFPWPGAARGRHGTGQVTLTSFSVPPGSLSFWSERAQRHGFSASASEPRFGEEVLSIADPDGLAVELVASAASEGGDDGVDVPAEAAIRGIASATLTEANPARTVDLLTRTLGFREVAREGERIRLAVGDGGPGQRLDIVADPSLRRGLNGAGTVHHIAFRTPDDQQQLAWSEALMREGHDVSPVMDRNYFHSIYFREPGGVLFEIATDPPGFTVDEPVDSLGSELKLPPMYEPMRERIVAVLPAITVPVSGLVADSY
jgi:glyoxalase family protein